jgi:hypothetical protein
MCNHYKANADWRLRMGEHSETKIHIPQFDFSSPRANVQAVTDPARRGGRVLVRWRVVATSHTEERVLSRSI